MMQPMAYAVPLLNCMSLKTLEMPKRCMISPDLVFGMLLGTSEVHDSMLHAYVRACR